MTISEAAERCTEALGLTPREAARLSGNLWLRVLRFSVRWECFEGVLDQTDELLALGHRGVSVYDARAEAFLALGRAREALAALEARHELRISVPSRRLYLRALLADGAGARALEEALELVREMPDSVVAWAALCETKLALGDTEGAMAACASLGALRPNGVSYLLARMDVHRALGDHVVAGAYASRLEATADGDRSLPAYLLRRLLSYYRDTGQPTRVRHLRRQLDELYASECNELRAALDNADDRAPRRGAETRLDREAVSADGPAVVASGPAGRPTLSPEAVPVSDADLQRLERGAKELFGFHSLRPGQAESMAAALRGEDVLTVLPTGGGKSLCYQLPALLDGGTYLVISPLIALMKDQVDSLPEAVRPLTTTLNSSLSMAEMDRRMAMLASGGYRLIYAAPERLRQAPFLHALRRAGVSRLVVDEAHCISMWGHDFRPDYLYIDRARRELGDPPVLAMTATAPPIVKRDIVERLRRNDARPPMRVVSGAVTRPNLFFEVIRVRDNDDKLAHLVGLCQETGGSGIVYVGSRARSEQLAAMLRRQGMRAGHYHAGIGDRVERAAAQDRFMCDEVRVMVATIAFGMGVDKADIRFIVHYSLPSSVESYYQEAGRAGRDGMPSRCTVLYSPFDRGVLTSRSKRDALDIPFLRKVYASVRSRLGSRRLGRVAIDDLRRDLRADGTAVRVAVGMLEQAGLLRRYGDLPRAVTLCLSAPVEELGGVPHAPELHRLVRELGLAPRTFVECDPVRLSPAMDLTTLEARLLMWRSLGILQCQASQRDMLIELVPVPDGAAERVHELVEQYEMIQARRVEEIVRYAKSDGCRHGHLAGYLTGEGFGACKACDNCCPTEDLLTARRRNLPAEVEQLAAILRCLQESRWGWGRMSLARILRADPRMADRASDSSYWGVLSYRSDKTVRDLIERLIEKGLITVADLDSGGAVLRLSAEGARATEDPSRLAGILPQARPSGGNRSSRVPLLAPEEGPPDDALLERLQTWRTAKASEAQLPAYRIAHNSLLRRLACVKPRTGEELLAVKGIGPRRLELYGDELLALIGETPGKAGDG